MTQKTFGLLALLIGLAFAAYFAIYVFPPVLESGDIIGAFAAGFVNPFAAGYSIDTIFCGLILIVWILYDWNIGGPPYGWVCIPLVFIPGVATAFGLYLFMRSRHASIGEK